MIKQIIDLGISKTEAEELQKVSKNLNKDYKLLKKGYPVQYLIGYSSFCGYKIFINKHTLIPRYETEFLVEKTINYIHKYFKENITIADIASGTACIAVALKKQLPASTVIATDISSKALKVAKKNIKENNISITLLKGNMLKPIKQKIDILVSNPPYISKSESISYIVKKYEPQIALYAPNNGIKYYEEILKGANKILNKKSLIAFEIGCTQGSIIKNIALKYFPHSTIKIEKDLASKNRYIFIFNNI
ncbi:MAG: peptide chain release factor N(5)-glutamine methyltransferase [Bacilli bacterium]